MEDRLLALVAASPPAVRSALARGELLRDHTTLRVGGPADLFWCARDADLLAKTLALAQRLGAPVTLLGGGSNVCVSDRGVRGLVVRNRCERATIGLETRSDAGKSLMQLFVDTARAGLSGLEFAVGIPGTLGGAMVSNAGAYQQAIADVVDRIDVVEGGERRVEGVDWMRFSYRDSRLRHPGAEPAAVVGVWLKLRSAGRKAIFDRARQNQRNRIHRQPWQPSAGSFFKNVYDASLAAEVPGVPDLLRAKGIVPAGILSAACGCKGLAVGGAQISLRHGNFVVNRGGATAADIRLLADRVRRRVLDRFGVTLEEEVLYVGDWTS